MYVKCIITVWYIHQACIRLNFAAIAARVDSISLVNKCISFPKFSNYMTIKQKPHFTNIYIWKPSVFKPLRISSEAKCKPHTGEVKLNIPLPFLYLSILQLFPKCDHLSLHPQNHENSKEEIFPPRAECTYNFVIRKYTSDEK